MNNRQSPRVEDTCARAKFEKGAWRLLQAHEALQAA